MNAQNDSMWKPITIAILICLILWIGGMFLTHWMANTYFKVDINDNAPALFGDSFGAVNALISAFAFTGVIVSMYLQRKDLKLQRESLEVQQEELKQNTEELKLQREEFKDQNKTMRLQRFENTFFNMLSLQQEIVNNLSFSYQATRFSPNQLKDRGMGENRISTAKGRNIFEGVYLLGMKDVLLKYGYKNFSKLKILNQLDHYFSHLYRIIKFVDETHLLENEKERYSYITILRSTLSRYELVFLFYNELNFSEFKKLIEEYSLFNNLHEDSLVDSKEMTKGEQWDQLYAPSAYDPDIKGYNKELQ